MQPKQTGSRDDSRENNFYGSFDDGNNPFNFPQQPINNSTIPPPNHWPDRLSIDWAQDFLETESAKDFSVHGGNVKFVDELTKKKISDAQTYGPRFCAIFDQYQRKCQLNIDIRRHLMALCTEHIITFIKWARESDQQITWISQTLFENDYLRPEVRNGVVMVLIYTFASIKATLEEIGLTDMFLTLQDNEQGLGIANKFSLKIYNDPFNYLSFLKTSISGLIDAGLIPDNERQNQPKKANKVQYQNKEEIIAFQRIQKVLVELLDHGNNAAAKAMVNHITTFWQHRGKVIIIIITIL
jgi:hypothetical protein